MQKSTSHPQAFTLVELLVVLAVIGVLVTLILPAFGRTLLQARSEKCLGNLRQLGTAALLYAADNNMTLPLSSHSGTSTSWSTVLREYAGERVVFKCPTDENRTRTYTYVLNEFLTPNPPGTEGQDFNYSRINRIASPRETLLFTELSRTYTSNHIHFSYYRGAAVPPEIFASQVAVKRHGDSANYFFVDGHVENLTWAEVQKVLGTPGTRFLDPTGFFYEP